MIMQFEIVDNKTVVVRFKKGEPICRLDYRLLSEAGMLGVEALSTAGNGVKASFGTGTDMIATVEDVFREDSGHLVIERTSTFSKKGSYRLVQTFLVSFDSEPSLFVPSVLYKDNRMGRGAFPRRTMEEPQWSFIESRTPLPGITVLYTKEQTFAICCDPSRSPRLSISTSTNIMANTAEVTLWDPGVEWPKRYSGKNALVATTEGEYPRYKIERTGDRLRLINTIHISFQSPAGNSPFSCYRHFIEMLQAPQKPVNLVSWSIYHDLKLLHLLSLIKPGEDQKTAYIAMGRNNGAVQEFYEYTAGSFLVKSLEAAVILANEGGKPLGAEQCALLEAVGEKLGKAGATMEEIAIMIGNFFLQGERAPGIHQDCYDCCRRIWGGYFGISEQEDYRYWINARCNGEVMSNYIALYEVLREKGIEIPEFIELPKRVARFYIKYQLTGRQNGSFGRWWTHEGRAVNSLGTNGAYIVSMLCAIEPYMKIEDGIGQAITRAGAYYGQLVEMGEYFGDTLDADCCDKEAGVTLMSMFLDLYERDGDPQFLTYAKHAAEFVATWIWQYDQEFPSSSPLAARRFSTTGMTSVSVAHHHLDFYGMLIACGYLRLWEYTGETFFKDQGVMMLDACRQLVATPRDLLGRSPEEVGWQPEQINHTDWDYFDRPDCRHGSFDIDIAWVTVLGLRSYQKLEKRYPELFLDEGDL